MIQAGETATSGSPPYTWGAPGCFRLAVGWAGITPIYMGSTETLALKCALTRDHPHIHGEHFNGRKVMEATRGSPPYTWGAQTLAESVLTDNGITPIYMGSTGHLGLGIATVQDHPHIHGEHRDHPCGKSVRRGSPPYTWGAQKRILVLIIAHRITPIYMGSTACY